MSASERLSCYSVLLELCGQYETFNLLFLATLLVLSY